MGNHKEDLIEALAHQTLMYNKNHRGRNNIQQRNALENITILKNSLDSIVSSENTKGGGNGCVGIIIVAILVAGAVLVFG